VRIATALTIAFLASPALAAAPDYDPSPSDPVWRLFPSEVQPYRPGTVPLHLQDRDFAANRSDDGGGYAAGRSASSYSDTHGSSVAIRGIQSQIQGIRQEYGGNNSLGGSAGQQMGGSTGVGVCGCH
jgi:hypothetical protein